MLGIKNQHGPNHPYKPNNHVPRQGIGGGLKSALVFGKVDDREFGRHFDGADGCLDTGQ